MLETGQTASSAERPKAAATITSQSRVFKLAETPSSKSATGGESWNFGGGMLTTGEWVRVHESLQPAGAAHSPEHVIDHTELICVMAGEMEYRHGGVTDHAVPGDILLVARGTNHYVRNAGRGRRGTLCWRLEGMRVAEILNGAVIGDGPTRREMVAMMAAFASLLGVDGIAGAQGCGEAGAVGFWSTRG